MFVGQIMRSHVCFPPTDDPEVILYIAESISEEMENESLSETLDRALDDFRILDLV
jgi:hypothetical protein